MYSCQSPVKPYTGVASTVDVNSPKSSKVSISLNGLFGESADLDDLSTASLSSQSLVSNSFLQNKTSTSPTKSPNAMLNYNAQPVLLSELAECLPHNGLCSGTYHGTTLCSYVSPYDNSRCTNMAAALAAGKSLCHNHLGVSLQNQPSTPSTFAQYVNVANTTYSPTSFCFTNPTHNASQYVTSVTNNPHPGIIQNSAPRLVDGNVGIKRSASVMSSTLKTVDVMDGQLMASLAPSVGSNYILPVSYVNIANQFSGVKSRKPTKSKHSQKLHVNSSYNPLVTTSLHQLPGNNTKLNQTSIRSRGNNTVVDGDVLQAFVDFLNQNHHHMTIKQQIDLLTSLGVAVETVNSPRQFPLPNKPMISPPLTTKVLPTDSPVCNVSNQFHVGKQNHTNPNIPVSINSPIPPSVIGTMQSLPVSLKRKNSCTEQHSNSKKPKNSSNQKSLQHLTLSELDQRISEALASMGRLSADSQLTSKLPTSNKLKPKSISSSCNAPNWKKMSLKAASVPTLPIPMNPNCCCIGKETITNEALKEYVSLRNIFILKNQNLFPVGPFCDDKDICSCSLPKCTLQHLSKLKQKSSVKTKPKLKTCFKCRSFDMKHPYTNASESLLRTVLCSRSRKSDKSLADMKSVGMSGSLEITLDSSKPRITGALSETNTTRINCRRHLDKSIKMWKGLYKGEKNSIRLLIKAVASDANETARVLKKMGVQPIGLSRRFGICASKPSQCSLTDRTGDRCVNTSLPMSPYCREHIWHSDRQQLYKLGGDMNVVADVYPDPPTVRQRKKTKPPPLTKKKRRNRKGKLAKQSKAAISGQEEGSSVTGLKLFGANLKSSQKLSQHVIPDSMMDNFDLSESNSTHMTDMMNDPSMSQKINLLNDNLPITVDEESSSGVFEAFSIDGAELLNDMPDMFSELGFFNGKNGEVLDNALLLAGAIDTENSDKLNADKLSFDEFNDNELLFSSSISETNLLPPSTTSNDELDPSRTMEMSIPNNNCSKNSTVNSEYLSESFPVLSQSNNSNPESITSSMSTCVSSGVVDKWFASQFGSEGQLGVGETTGNLSSSLDSSFAEELDELQGVIQSLRDETDKANSQTSCNASQIIMNPEEYTTDLARELSLEIENQVFGVSTSHQSPQPVDVSWNKDSLAVESLPSIATKPNLSIASQTTFSNNSQVQAPSGISSSQRNVIACSSPVGLKSCDRSKAGQRSKSLKKSKNKISLNKTNLIEESQRSSVKDRIAKSNVAAVTNTENSITSRSEYTKTTSEPSTKTNKITSDHEKTRTGKRPRCTVPVPGFIPAATQPMVALAPSFRMQPKLMANTMLCSAGKMNNTLTNQSMVLIPVNALLRSGNQTTIQAGHQGVGLAFTIPPRTSLSNGTVIPIRASAVLSGSNNSQQLIILNGNPGVNAPICTTMTLNAPAAPSQSRSDDVKLNLESSKPPSRPNIITSSCSSHYSAASKAQHVQQHKISSNQTKLSLAHSTQVNSRLAPGLPLKNKTNLKRESPVVIPPVLTSQSNTISLQSQPNTLSGSITAVCQTEGARLVPSSKSATVHWNQTMAGPDTSQSRMSGSVGGQTSNMLYCRRISPSLSNAQHVIVGRLGSLGRMGLSRVTVTDPSTRRANHPASTRRNQSDGATSSVTKQRKPPVSVGASLTTNAFIPLSPTANRTSSCSTNSEATSGLVVGCKPQEGDALCRVTNVVDSAGGEGVVASHSNARLQIYNKLSTLDCNVTSVSTGNPPDIINPTTLTSPRHSSRKSDHTMMLEDPDFCESPTKVSSAEMMAGSKAVAEMTSSKTFGSFATSQTRNFNIIPDVSLNENTLFNGGKPRRTSILRK